MFIKRRFFSFLLMTELSSMIERAIDDVYQGKPILLVDSPNREDEGDFVIAAECVTYQNIGFLLTHSSRMLCVSMQKERLHLLGLHPVVEQPTKKGSCSFYTPVDARNGDTGLGIEDRLAVLDALLYDPVSVHHHDSRLSIPGHTFPLCAHPEGLLGRQGHTEGSLTLVELAKLASAAVIAEAWDCERHRPLKGKYVGDFAREHAISVIAIDALLQYIQSK